MNLKKMIIVLIIIISICFAIALYLGKKNKIQNEDSMQRATTTYDERILWNDILNNNKYLSEMNLLHKILKDETGLVKIALVSDEVKEEYINEEDIKANYLLTKGDGFKKSIQEINKYLEENFDQSSLEYNFVNTYVEDGNYLLIDESYVYFTKIDVPEKVYIAVEYNVDDSNYVVKIYEYDITEDNKEFLNNMLETGNIDKSIDIANEYKIKGKIEDGKIKIHYKYKKAEDLSIS